MRQSTHTLDCSLYIHIPFCIKKCPYCAFYKEFPNQSLESEFIDALLKEIHFYGTKLKTIKSVFIGGGTPNALTSKSLTKLFTALHTNFDLNNQPEITIEMNPDHITKTKLTLLKKFQVNRLSLGIQSFHTTDLHFLGRTHSVETTHKTITMIQDLGFNNINLDLIFGLPNTSLDHIKHNIKKFLSYTPKHISTYGLTIEENTPFHKDNVAKLSSDLERDQFEYICNTLRDHGYNQYEVSNFSLPGFEACHNLNYWQFGDYIGLGPSAHSFFNGHRFNHPSSLKSYINNPIHPSFTNTKRSMAGDNDLCYEYIISSLRLPLQGLDIQKTNTLFNIDFEHQFKKQLSTFFKLNLLTKHSNHIKVTRKGLYILDEILTEFN